jgi:hypothetical protein
MDKLLDVGFIKPVEQTTSWLSPIVVVPKKNGKLRIYVDFQKLKVSTKKDPYLLPFMDEVINIIIGHEIYTLLNKFLGYHHISIALEDHKTTFVINWGVFVWVVMPFGVKNGSSIYQRAVTKTFREYIEIFMKIFFNDFKVSMTCQFTLGNLENVFLSVESLVLI